MAIVKCPFCRGNPFAKLNPFEQTLDWSCLNCDGKGTIDDQQTCICGRPAVKIAGVLQACTSSECESALLKMQENSVNTDFELKKWYESDMYAH